jgi:hypothetical protein
VRAYVVDTGGDSSHGDFAGRLVQGFSSAAPTDQAGGTRYQRLSGQGQSRNARCGESGWLHVRGGPAGEDQGLRSRLLLQVHDELVLEVAPGELGALEEAVREAMGQAAELSVPLEVSVGRGSSWHEAGH